ncbi:hypothetical protein [Rudanella lutea]|uniref:hypothetical protein n=1 Tax=Rudanella lutea TaxID=451374 RepID=UPI000365A0E2|nr:hypothetical protein [Rudanella lutea]
MRYIVWLVLLASCRPDPAPTALPDSSYFPLQAGSFRVYSVTEHLYRPGQVLLTRQYQWRHTTGAPFLGLSGNNTYPITYAHRLNSDSEWHTDSVGATQLTAAEALLTHGGQTTVTLAFPVANGTRWNGNRYRNDPPDEFVMQQCHTPFRTGEKDFARTLTVIQQNDSTLVSQDKRIEVYAQGAGLVYAERQQVRYCAAESGCGSPTAIKSGIRQFIRLTDYGNK